MIRKNFKKIILLMVITTIIASLCFFFNNKVFSTTNEIEIFLSDLKITVDGENISEDSAQKIYLSRLIDNGGTSEEALEANIEIDNIINITSAGTYEFTGELSNGQISVNSNVIDGDVIIILNNVEITCEDAPAIFVYNSATKSDKCNVIIKTTKESTNTISGGKIKQSVENWEDQSEILYYIDKGYDDDGTYYERYKYDGAISSDISLTFEGEGALTVNALKKEGIESKRDITINSGNYEIYSLDDGINACTDNESIITINGGSILVSVVEEAEEGDGIDSNGYIYINDGYVYAFACESSQDSGLDSDKGTYINGGYVVGTGNMGDTVNSDSKQTFKQFQFNEKVSKGDLITITDADNNTIVAFMSDREYSILTISTKDLVDEVNVYEGGSIKGTNENGLYTKITSYEEGTIKEYTAVSDFGMMREFNKNTENKTMNFDLKILNYVVIGLIVILIILIIILIVFRKKAKVFGVIIGILIGVIITTSVFLVVTKKCLNNFRITTTQQGEQMPDGGRGFDDNKEMKNDSSDNKMLKDMEKSDGEPPENLRGNNNL
jgi:hypothetical protein